MLSKKAKYAIKALLYLGREKENQPSLISDISERESIPKKFLEAILLELRNAGYLGSKKGKGGGYFLVKKPDDMNLADIVRLFDGAIAMVPCAAYKYYEPCDECEDEFTCSIRDLFKQLRDKSVEFLKAKTIGEMLEKETRLKEEKAV
jgi:Rrf2 family protein